jgi:hypothetical protein
VTFRFLLGQKIASDKSIKHGGCKACYVEPKRQVNNRFVEVIGNKPQLITL